MYMSAATSSALVKAAVEGVLLTVPGHSRVRVDAQSQIKQADLSLELAETYDSFESRLSLSE